VQARHPLVLEQLDAVDAVEAVVLHHEERRVDAEPVQHRSLPLALVPLLAPVVLNADSQNAVGVRGQRVAQLAATPLSGNANVNKAKSYTRCFVMTRVCDIIVVVHRVMPRARGSFLSTYLPLFLDMPPESQRLLVTRERERERETGQGSVIV